MLVGYFRVCPRKAWLSLRGLWMEQESDAVRHGRLLDETTYARRSARGVQIEATAPDGTPLVGKLDGADLRRGVLHEVKRGRSCEDAHKDQLRFYLWLLKRCGVAGPGGQALVGQLDYPVLRRTERVPLRPEDEEALAQIVAAVAALAEQPEPPARHARRSFCRRCAFEELCYG